MVCISGFINRLRALRLKAERLGFKPPGRSLAWRFTGKSEKYRVRGRGMSRQSRGHSIIQSIGGLVSVMKKTEWYPAHVKPVRKGWYEIDLGFKKFGDFAYWTGKSWSWGTGASRLFNQNRQWRGLTEPA